MKAPYLALLIFGGALAGAGTWSCSSDDPAGSGGSGGEGGSANGPASATNNSQMASSSTGVSAATCEGYCQAMEDNCVDEDPTTQQWPSQETCLAACAVMPPGMPGRADTAQNGNNLECRNYWASGPATTNKGACLDAGPTGSNTCGDECENFCFFAEEFCAGAWDDNQACLDECVAFPKPNFGDPSFNVNTYQSGDSYMCRMNQLLKAMTDATPNCPNIVAASTVCADGTGGAQDQNDRVLGRADDHLFLGSHDVGVAYPEIQLRGPADNAY